MREFRCGPGRQATNLLVALFLTQLTGGGFLEVDDCGAHVDVPLLDECAVG